MKYMKTSTTYTNRQAFVSMIESILKDFCELPQENQTKADLIEGVIIKHFHKDLLDISKDKVVNVRIQLADSFYTLQEKYESITDQINDKKESLQTKKALSDIKNKIDQYLNRYFYKVLRNLKYDESECVTEYLHGLYVFQEERASPELEFDSRNQSPNILQTLPVPTTDIGDDALRSLSNTSDLLGSQSLDDLGKRKSLDQLLEVDQIEELRGGFKEYNITKEDLSRDLIDEPQMVDEPIVEQINGHRDDTIEVLQQIAKEYVGQLLVDLKSNKQDNGITDNQIKS